MSQEEINQRPICPYCSNEGDDCVHVFAVIDLCEKIVDGPAGELFDPPYLEEWEVMGGLVSDIRMEYFEEFEGACVEESDYSMQQDFDSGWPGSSTLIEWCWVKDVKASLRSFKKKIDSISLTNLTIRKK